jgi:hypothetical protein
MFDAPQSVFRSNFQLPSLNRGAGAGDNLADGAFGRVSTHYRSRWLQVGARLVF